MVNRPPEEIALPALAAQVADLRDQLRALTARMEAAGMAGGARLHEQVAELGRALADLVEEGTIPRPSAPTWIGLERDEFTRQLAALTEWVNTVLLPHYPHVKVTPCWARHPAAVWELGNIWAEWQRAYGRKRPELDGALTWHDRWLPGAEVRLGKILKECSLQGCGLLRARALAQPPSRPWAV